MPPQQPPPEGRGADDGAGAWEAPPTDANIDSSRREPDVALRALDGVGGLGHGPAGLEGLVAGGAAVLVERHGASLPTTRRRATICTAWIRNGNSSRVSRPMATPRFQPREADTAAAEGAEALDLALDGPLVVLEGGEALLDHRLGALQRIAEEVVVEALAAQGVGRLGRVRAGGCRTRGRADRARTARRANRSVPRLDVEVLVLSGHGGTVDPGPGRRSSDASGAAGPGPWLASGAPSRRRRGCTGR